MNPTLLVGQRSIPLSAQVAFTLQHTFGTSAEPRHRETADHAARLADAGSASGP
jgi:hypothetical protein